MNENEPTRPHEAIPPNAPPGGAQTLNRPGFDGGSSALIAHAAATWATAA
jgi:hypothetical protein